MCFGDEDVRDVKCTKMLLLPPAMRPTALKLRVSFPVHPDFNYSSEISTEGSHIWYTSK